jgi:4-hydroxybutyryl-CoA dehydratase/vinylacetyl-CoA-Delta-isomerase
MALKTPQQYIDSLRDGRVTYWDGERIDDITTHPRFQVPIGLVAADYRYDDAEYGALRRYATEDGSEAHRIYQIPRSEADLGDRVELMQHTSIGTLVTGVYMALMSVKDDVARVNPMYAENIERMYRYCRDNDLRAAEVITDPKGDRKRRAHEQDDPDLYVRIVERRKDGIVVRGAKLHITAASLVHELVVMPTKGMRQEESDYAVSFSIPVNAPGVKIINRSFAPAELNAFDYPASSHHSVPEGFVVFDDVFVPWDRVFLAGEVQLASKLAQSLGLWERTGGLVEAVRMSELFVGLAQLVTEMQGKDQDPIAQNSISELITYAEMLRMALGLLVPPLREHGLGDGLPQHSGHQRLQVLLRRQLSPDRALPARPGRRTRADAAARERPAQPGIRQVHPQVPAYQARRRRRDAHAGLQHDPRPDGGRLRRLAVRRRIAGGGRPACPTRDDEPHLRHGEGKAARLEGCRGHAARCRARHGAALTRRPSDTASSRADHATLGRNRVPRRSAALPP